ncbi:hypothetical protein RhiirA5_413402 [Rhizophagus irregularis]|uniref:Uncharacterized protein n=1 Tax=Rhizophagus irregularis TaxID=588596 RepID=A0A2N0PWG0_9GLOM|nr:hypothetical protein RhiirA5_413402 [Rhizophagus irregularis]
MAQILLNRTLSYSKNFFITKNQSTLLIKSSQIIYKPIIIRSIQSCSWQTPNHTNHTKLTKTVSDDYVNESYDSGGKILRDFINKIEIKIYENNARLIGEPIDIVFNNNNIQDGRYYEFNQFRFNGKYIISVFGNDIRNYFKSHFPNLKITFVESINTGSITITNYLNRDIILKKTGIGIWDY